MFAYLKFELRRLAREPRLFLFTVFMPVVSYVVFTGVGSGHGQMEGVTVATGLMIGMAAYGAIIGVLSIGVGVSLERSAGWLRQLRLTPLPPAQVVLVKAFLATLTALPSVISVGIAGYFQHHVTLSPGRWIAIVLLMWLGTLPFALMGLAVGYAAPPTLAQPASFISFFGLSVLGGLLVPVAAFPNGLQHLAHLLPSNRYAELGWRAASGALPTMPGLALLVGWTALFGVLAAAAYRRSTATR
jgi:ABC-2 type transport system permease protein